MPMTTELKRAAEDLGNQLRADSNVQEYLRLAAQVQESSAVSDLEARYNQVYQSLTEREQQGEVLDRPDLDEYYRLKAELQHHPLVMARDDRLVLVKALFAQTAERLTNVLGFEYTTFAE